MPRIIAFLSQTGNVMKTTLAAALGVTLAGYGIRTAAIDLDPEHRKLGASLATWADKRANLYPHREQLPVLPMIDPADPDPTKYELTAAEAIELAHRTDAEVVLIDCASRATEAAALIAAHADFVVLPIVPGAKDAILTLSAIMTILQAGLAPHRLAIVLTRIGSDAEAAEERHWLNGSDFVDPAITVLEATIPERINYRDAVSRGLTIAEANPVSLARRARAALDALIAAYVTAQDKPETTPDTFAGAA